MRVPPAADQPRRPRPARQRGPQALPRRLGRAQADLRPRPRDPASRPALRRADRRQPRRGPRPLVPRRCGHRQDLAGDADRPGGGRRRPVGRRLLGPASARRDPQHIRPRLQRLLLPRPVRPPLHRRPARARRPGRGEDHRVGARAALLDRQRALAELGLRARHHERARPAARHGGRRAAAGDRRGQAAARERLAGGVPARRGAGAGALGRPAGRARPARRDGPARPAARPAGARARSRA